MRLARDPRHYQIAVLGSLLVYGLTVLDFDVGPAQVLLSLSLCLLTQAAFSRFRNQPFDPRSPLISGLSLCLLLRTNSLALAALAAFVTIAGKFVFRWRGKHLFNPTNFGLVALMVATGRVWVSPAQWGSFAFFAAATACLGMLVVFRATRADVTWAFLGFHLAILFGRALWLGQPMAIPLHQLSQGAVLIFAFFMISDPKTTPDSRAGRILFAALVALGGAFVTFKLFRPNGLLLSLAAFSLCVPLIDRWLPGRRYAWNPGPDLPHRTWKGILPMIPKRALLLAPLLLWASDAAAFCGFYVAKADTQLFNQASKVVMVRDGDRTVLTMANDYQGDPKEFAVVVPVPTVLKREQIHVADPALVDHLDAYSAPRLVEYFDGNPCQTVLYESAAGAAPRAAPSPRRDARREKQLGVTVEARYTVGEYDIVILSAKQSSGLETWLVESGYRIPAGASRALGSYIKQNLRFFVAKVNLREQAKLGYTYLRPLQMAYESPRFMLPIRLGMVNASGPQELFVFALTRRGRVETTNYRTVRLPSDLDLPLFVKGEFGSFYKAMFREQVRREDGRAVFLEYAWDMGWCDPCAADPLSRDELRNLGVFWETGGADRSGGQNVFLTRLHVRYDAAHFPEDLVFQQTADRQNFQGRYVLRHPWTGDDSCEAARTYRSGLPRRWDQEARNLASLTGWNLNKIRGRMNLKAGAPSSPPKGEDESWWEKLWKE